MELVIAIIVILVVAIVILTIFGPGISPVPDFASQRNVCVQSGSGTCSTTGSLPLDWQVPKPYKQGDQVLSGSCAELVGGFGTPCTTCGTCPF